MKAYLLVVCMTALLASCAHGTQSSQSLYSRLKYNTRNWPENHAETIYAECQKANRNEIRWNVLVLRGIRPDELKHNADVAGRLATYYRGALAHNPLDSTAGKAVVFFEKCRDAFDPPPTPGHGRKNIRALS